MSRPQKRTVDYFPHYVNHGKTLLILQNEFGNNGYAFWFKLLSLLCKTDGQVYDYNNYASWKLLLAETQVSDDIATNMLQILADIDAISPELHQHKVIWIQNLVDNLEDVYKRRGNGSMPIMPVIVDNNVVYGNKKPVNVNNNPQTKLNKTKQDKTNNTEHFNKFWEIYPKKRSKGQAEKAFSKITLSEELLEVIFASIKKAKDSEQWLKNGGQYVPYPATWLNAKGWEDEVDSLPTFKKNPRALPTKYTRPEEL